MGWLSKLRYYATSIPTLLMGYRRPLQTIAVFLGMPGAVPAEFELRHHGWRFRVRSAMDAWIIKETCLDRAYLWTGEAPESHWAVVDIGAGLGDFTVLAAKMCADGLIHAYEPLEDSFDLLEHNLEINDVTNVRAFRTAVSATGRPLAAVVYEGAEAVSTRFVPDDGPDLVASITLQDLLDRLPGGRCDLMKIDCEGCEFDLLLGCPLALLERIERISLEYHDEEVDGRSIELEGFLTAQGYIVKRRRNPVHPELGLLYATRGA